MDAWLFWSWGHINELASAIAVITALGIAVGWLVRVFLASKRRFEELMEVFQPTDGSPNFRETMQTLTSGLRNMTTELGTLKKSSTDNSEMIADISAGLRAVAEDDHTPTFETDLRGAWTYSNPALLDIAERPWDHIKGRGWEVLLPQLERDRVTAGFQSAVSAQRVFDEEFVVISRLGNRYRVHCIAKPKICRMGLIRGYLGRFVTWTPENVPNGAQH